MKLSCEVIADLLPSYLDGICSKETKALVEEHLLGCAGCSGRMREMGEVELVAERGAALELEPLKKLKAHMERKNLVHFGLLATLLLVGMAILIKNFGDVPLELYYFALPILLAGAYLILSDRSPAGGAGKASLWPGALGGILLGFIVLVEFLLDGWMKAGTYPFGIAAMQVGPILFSLFLAVAGAEIVIFGGALWQSIKSGRPRWLTLTTALTGSCLALSFLSLIKRLDDVSAYGLVRNRILLILLMEALLLAALLLGLERRKNR